MSNGQWLLVGVISISIGIILWTIGHRLSSQLPLAWLEAYGHFSTRLIGGAAMGLGLLIFIALAVQGLGSSIVGRP